MSPLVAHHAQCGKSLLLRLASTAAASWLQGTQIPWAAVNRLSSASCLLISNQQDQQQQHSNTWLPQQQWHSLQHTWGFRSSAAACSRQLRDIMKVDLLVGKTADEVEHIWLAHHAASETHVATAMSKDECTILSARAAASPLFVLPLSKKPGMFLTLLLQWQLPNRLLFTTVDEYKQWGPQAPPHMTVQLFDDVADTHGLVLARGDLINPGLINAAEGRTLLELARAFYRDPAAYQMVYAFNHKPQQFDFQQLCRELGVSTVTRGDMPAPPT